MKFLPGRGRKPLLPPLWTRKLRSIALILATIEIIAVIANPVILLQQGKSVGRFLEHRHRRLKVAYFNEKYGTTLGSWYEATLEWGYFGKDIQKGWNIVTAPFKGRG